MASLDRGPLKKGNKLFCKYAEVLVDQLVADDELGSLFQEPQAHDALVRSLALARLEGAYEDVCVQDQRDALFTGDHSVGNHLC